MKIGDIYRLMVSIIIVEAVGGIGAIFTTPAIPVWYASLKKSSLNPPNWIFGPAWTILFLLIGVSLFLIWRQAIAGENVRLAITVFVFQIALNVLWSIIFFGLKLPLAGFVEIIVLWIVILANTIVFYRISAAAGLLLIPYLCWVGFASYLNLSVYLLNK